MYVSIKIYLLKCGVYFFLHLLLYELKYISRGDKLIKNRKLRFSKKKNMTLSRNTQAKHDRSGKKSERVREWKPCKIKRKKKVTYLHIEDDYFFFIYN